MPEGNEKLTMEVKRQLHDGLITDADALARANRKLSIALEAGLLGSFEMDLTSYDIDCNDMCKEHFGDIAVKNFNFSDIVGSASRDGSSQVQNKVASAVKEKIICDFEVEVLWKDGSIHTIRFCGKPIYDDNGLPLTLVGVTFDITAQRQLEKQKDEFIAIASHELKTPITSLKGYLQVLQKTLERSNSSDGAVFLQKMDQQVDRITGLINDLLDVTKINAGKLQLVPMPLQLNKLIKEVSNELQLNNSVHVFNYYLEASGEIVSDGERVEQVLMNILTNAIKYSPNSDIINVSTHDEDDTVVVSVEDFGIGISEADKTQIFEQFYRVSGEKQLTYPGLGLGLYIASQIVTRLNGKLWVESNMGTGSKFCFSLPATFPAKQKETSNAA